MTIKEIEERLQVTRANVRFYEKEGLLFPRRNPLNGYREYSEEDVETLRKIVFFRSLDVSIEKIRLYMEEKVGLHEILEEQICQIREKQETAMQARSLCEKLLEQEEQSFACFTVPGGADERPVLIRDTLHRLAYVWDTLLVWGMFALQAFYTLFMYPLLPGEIPTDWNGLMAVEYHGKSFFLYYLVLSIVLLYGIRVAVFSLYCPIRLRCYLDEVCALCKAGGIGFSFSQQVYTVLSWQGIPIGYGAFMFGAAAVYILLVLVCWRLFIRRGEGDNR
ncbi:MAG TPA: hypothetical protein DF613_02385 [Lachnospiraceae bacterium]|nr:hypothetical protein [Lachnospiraceae bacterium]